MDPNIVCQKIGCAGGTLTGQASRLLLLSHMRPSSPTRFSMPRAVTLQQCCAEVDTNPAVRPLPCAMRLGTAHTSVTSELCKDEFRLTVEAPCQAFAHSCRPLALAMAFTRCASETMPPPELQVLSDKYQKVLVEECCVAFLHTPGLDEAGAGEIFSLNNVTLGQSCLVGGCC